MLLVLMYLQVGSWAGNLMLTHDNDNFPSDVYTIMEAAGATVTIATSVTNMKSYKLSDFLQVSMATSVLVSMEIPFLKTNEMLQTYKVMPRAQVKCFVIVTVYVCCMYIRTCHTYVCTYSVHVCCTCMLYIHALHMYTHSFLLSPLHRMHMHM